MLEVSTADVILEYLLGNGFPAAILDTRHTCFHVPHVDCIDPDANQAYGPLVWVRGNYFSVSGMEYEFDLLDPDSLGKLVQELLIKQLWRGGC